MQGKRNALSRKELCNILSLNPRDLTAGVERERRAGQPICASTTDPTGYYLAENKEEMQQYCNSLMHRVGEIKKTHSACLRTLDSLPPVESSRNPAQEVS